MSDLEMNSKRGLKTEPPTSGRVISFESASVRPKRNNLLEGGEGSSDSKASKGEILRSKQLKKFKEDTGLKP